MQTKNEIKHWKLRFFWSQIHFSLLCILICFWANLVINLLFELYIIHMSVERKTGGKVWEKLKKSVRRFLLSTSQWVSISPACLRMIVRYVYIDWMRILLRYCAPLSIQIRIKFFIALINHRSLIYVMAQWSLHNLFRFHPIIEHWEQV